MSGLSVKKRNQAALEEDDTIPEDLLNAIPEIDLGDAEEEEPITEEVVHVAVDIAPPTKEVHDLVSEIRREMENLFAKELDRVESSFNLLLQQMQQRLRAADEQLSTLKTERDALQASCENYERKFEAFRQMVEEK